MSINNLLKPAGTTTLRDYRHAARIFTDDNFRLSPKYGFLFYVEFDFNPLITSVSNTAAQEMGMIVKSVNLPKYTVETKTHNAYNRKNIVQNSIKYDPITITFHDDQADNVRNFWYDYYSYFYRDPDYADATYTQPHKYENRPSFNWGYTPKPAVGYNNANGHQPYQYIQAIRIYSLFQKNFSEYELINPIITSFKHGDHTNGEGTGTLQHEMSIQFETVKYYNGYVTSNNVGGFIDLHYDNTPSPIAPSQGTDLVDNGAGGYSHATDTITDLATVNIISTVASSIMYTQSGGSFATSWRTALTGTSGTVNAGGFVIPSLNLGGAITNASITQQLTAVATTTASQVVGSVSNAVVSGIAKGLGTNGQQIVGMIAQAISNPKLFLTTIASAAINVASALAGSYVTGLVNQYVAQPIFNAVSGAVGSLTNSISGLFSSSATAGAGIVSTGLPATIVVPVTGVPGILTQPATEILPGSGEFITASGDLYTSTGTLLSGSQAELFTGAGYTVGLDAALGPDAIFW